MVKEIKPGGGYDGGSIASNLTIFDGALYFGADDGTNGRELWRSDGSEAGTKRVMEVNPGLMIEFDGALYFNGHDDTHGNELWRTDGTREGTEMVGDFISGSSGSTPAKFIVYDGALYFTATDGTAGRELWRSDGTLEGTEMVKDINPGVDYSDTSGLTVWRSLLLGGGSQ